MRHALAALALLSLAALACPASAGPRRPRHHAAAGAKPDVRFLGLRPIGPLALVHDGRLTKPERRACRSWAPVGSRWKELDRLGRVAGVVRVSAREYYDYTKCDELQVTRVSGRPGAGVYVDARAAYGEPAVTSWRPEDASMTSLEHLVDARQKEIKDLDASPAGKVPFAKRTLLFAWTATGERYAVVGGRSLVVLALRNDVWHVVHETKPAKMRAVERGYAAVAVTDMDADGLPDLVVHNVEEQGEWYGDSTLSLRADGSWVSIDAGIFGSTA